MAGLTFTIMSAKAYAYTHDVSTKAEQAFVIDMNSHHILLDKDGRSKMYPASMTKMMTIYLVFQSLKNGELKLNQNLRVPTNAWKLGGSASGSSTMFLRPNQIVRVEDLIKGVLVVSGNDACITLAESLGGTEEGFAEEMNGVAKEIGLKHSHFMNSTGLPDPNHYTTGEDLAILTERLIKDFPEYFYFFSLKSFTYNGISQPNRNPLVFGFMGGDGMKTGHTELAGYSATGTAKRGNRRIIEVLNGMTSTKQRFDESKKLLSWAFRSSYNIEPFKAGQSVYKLPVWLGTEDTINLISKQDIILTIPHAKGVNIKTYINFIAPIKAPVKQGQHIADYIVNYGKTQTVFPLFSDKSVERTGFFATLSQKLHYKLGYNPYHHLREINAK